MWCLVNYEAVNNLQMCKGSEVFKDSGKRLMRWSLIHEVMKDQGDAYGPQDA